VYKQQIYQIAESNRIETFFARIGMLYFGSVYSRHLFGEIPPKKLTISPKWLPDCVLKIFFFGRDNELQIYHGNFLLMYDKHRKLFVKRVQIFA